MRDLATTVPFARSWVGIDLGDARPCDSMYCQYPLEDLPPLPTLNGTLRWLGQPGWMESPEVAPEQRTSRERWSAAARTTVRDLAMQAERLGLALPSAYIRLMTAPELFTRIPEYAGCWFNHGEAQLDPCPGSEDAYVVRFLNDQQDCILWYLYLTQRGDEAVLAVIDPYPDAPSNYLERLVRPDEDDPLGDQQRRAVLANTYACAPSFEAFVYRWWIEVTIYMKLDEYNSEPLTAEESRYLAHAYAHFWPE